MVDQIRDGSDGGVHQNGQVQASTEALVRSPMSPSISSIRSRRGGALPARNRPRRLSRRLSRGSCLPNRATPPAGIQ